ncbi:hypothetical protein FBU59_006181, partial [Linderina macrospora]
NATCSEAFASYKDSSNLVCVGPIKNKGGACNGDGLLLQEDSSNVALIGVLDLFASTDSQDNAQCDDKNVYNFYTAVENYMAWITQKTPLSESALISTATISTSGSGSSSSDDDSSEHSSKGDSSSKGGSSSKGEEGATSGLDSSSRSGAAMNKGSIAVGVALAAAAAFF